MGAYISMLAEVSKDMVPFMVVLVVVLLAMAHAFRLTGSDGDLLAWVQIVYRMGLLGDFETSDLEADGCSKAI